MMSEKISVALLCTALHERGGICRHLLNIYRHLNRDKFNVVLVYFSTQRKALEEFYLSEGILPQDLIFVPLKKSDLFLSGIFRISRILREKKIDLVHTFFLHSDIIGYFSGRQAGLSCLVSSVEGKFLWDKTNGVPGWKQACYRIMNRWIRPAFAATITVSQDLKQELLGLCPGARSVTVIPVGISLPEEHPPGSSPERSAELVIASLSRFSQDKGLEYFIRAMPAIKKEIPGARFIIAGAGQDEERLRALVQELNLQQDVSFPGWVQATGEFYSTIDVFVMPSVREGCPLGLLEALAYKKAVVAFASPGIKEVIEHEKEGLLVEPFKVEAFAQAVCQLCLDRKLAGSLGEEGRKLVLRSYTIQSEMRRIEEVYRQSIESSPGRTAIREDNLGRSQHVKVE